MTNHVPLRFARVVLSGALVTGAAVILPAAAGATSAPGAGTSPSTVRLVVGAKTRDQRGKVWRSDRAYATGGRVVRVGRQVAAADPRLFRSVRVGTFGYRIPVRPGVYSVRVSTVALKGSTLGRHAFAVRANGATRVAKVAAYRRVGTQRGYSVSFTVTVRSTRLALSFPGRRGAAVSSIAVVGRHALVRPAKTPAGTTATPTPRPTPTPTPRPSSTPPTPKPSTSTSPAPKPSTSTSPAPNPIAPATTSALQPTVTPESYGARGDGTTDDTAALQRTFDNAAGRTVTLTAGRVYAFRSVLHLRVAGLRVTGAATLLALDEQRSDVWLDADRITLDGGLTIRTKSTTKRWDTWDQMGVRLSAHTGITLRNVTVVGSAAAGVYVGGSDHFTLDRVTVQDTRADGIHMTAGASYGTVTSPVVRNSGDDGVAIVSYKQDGTPCHDITVTSPRVYGTTWGRGLSVVGGRNVVETDVYVADSSAAGIYLAAEGNPWYSAAPSNVTIDGGTIIRANKTTSVEHGAVFVLSGEQDVVPDTVVVKNLAIRDTVVGKRNLGVITYGANPRNVLFQNITITGGSAPAYEGNTAQSAYRLRSIVKDGVRLADRG